MNQNDLNRKTRISVMNKNNEPIEYEFSYDEIEDQLNDNANILGEGAFGIVWKVYHRTSNKQFAIKKIKDQKSIRLMDIEIPRELGNDCLNIIKFYAPLSAEGSIWIISELMDVCLHKFYKKAFELDYKISELFISKVACAIVNAIAYMSDLETIHRDIKPSNILINRTGEIKLCDFGVSAFTNNSICRSYKGCQFYMAPEKILQIGNGFSFKSDIWSLGISLIEIATGQHPYKRLELLELIVKILNEPSPNLNENSFSQELKNFVDKCLIKEENSRPTCQELLNEIFILNYTNENNDLELIASIVDLIR